MHSNESDGPHLSVVEVNDFTWGGVKWGIWDHDADTWRDDIGWFLAEHKAHEAMANALPGEQS